MLKFLLTACFGICTHYTAVRARKASNIPFEMIMIKKKKPAKIK